MSRKPANPRPWFCIACGAELPLERQQGRCLECLIGKRTLADLAADGGHITPLVLRETFGLPPLAQAEAEAALAEDRASR